MSDDFSESNSDAINEDELVIPTWEILFEDKKYKENDMILESLLNKEVKVWSVLANTVNGVRGTWKPESGVLTSVDDEFIVIDDIYYLNRKFIYRIELL